VSLQEKVEKWPQDLQIVLYEDLASIIEAHLSIMMLEIQKRERKEIAEKSA
jgi:hypothetical protein